MRKKLYLAMIGIVILLVLATAVYAKPQTHMVQMGRGDTAWVECDGGLSDMKVQPGMNKTLLIQCPTE